MLIDGNSLTYRAFFALPTDIATASGQVTNAVYGFTSMLLNLLRDHPPDRVVVAFDRPEPTFRHEQVATYKAQREEAPDILRQQMGLVRQVVDAFGFPVVESPGYEADDVLATLASWARDRGDEAVVVTGDRDVYQLVEDPCIKVLYTHSRGVSEMKEYDEAGVRERTGVAPGDYVTYAALRGDPSDNLPGVSGVGEKTAAKLVNAYGSLDEIFAHVGDQTPKMRERLAEGEDQVRTNAEVMRLVRDAPLVLAGGQDAPVMPDELAPGSPDPQVLDQLFGFLEFRSPSMLERLGEALAVLGAEAAGGAAGDGGAAAGGPGSGASEVDAVVSVVAEPADAEALLRELAAGEGPLALEASWAGDPGRSPLEGVAVVLPGAPEGGAAGTEGGAAPEGGAGDVAWIPGDVLAAERVAGALGALFGPDGRPVMLHGAKPLLRWLLDRGLDLRTLRTDTIIAGYLLDPADGRYVLEELLLRYVGLRIPERGEAAESGQLDLDGAAAPVGEEAALRAVATDRLAPKLLDALDARGLRRLHDEMEIPLVRVLARMEAVGVGVDADALRELNDRLGVEAESLRRQICVDAGVEFNVNSTPQLREILFDKLGLTPQRKTKTGYSTDAASLERLLGEHPIIEHLLRYREVEKLRSTYGEGLIGEIGPDGRIHATFNQTVARTGRLSSDKPNLHNIPVRSEEGRAFRQAFVAAPGEELLVADYNQIELRCIAHLAGDPGLIGAFEAGTDIHTETAARIFGVEPGDVSLGQRAQSKMVSYGLAYGMESYGLGQRLGIPTGEAQKILDAYFVAFPSVREYMERTVAEARERGYTETLFGRRRQIPELSSSNVRIRQAGERQAMNAGIQGLAADIFKVALVRIDEALADAGHRSRLILQVHDEVLVELHPDEVDAVVELVVGAMSGAFDLRVPLEVNLSRGRSWADAKAAAPAPPAVTAEG